MIPQREMLELKHCLVRHYKGSEVQLLLLYVDKEGKEYAATGLLKTNHQDSVTKALGRVHWAKLIKEEANAEPSTEDRNDVRPCEFDSDDSTAGNEVGNPAEQPADIKDSGTDRHEGQ